MCGLTGIFDVRNTPTDNLRAQVLRMADRIAHRGPDDEGTWVSDGIALGHRRLSILDLSQAGSQPMHSACGRYVLAFNGEIYNHLDLRRELEDKGAAPQWRGHSDSETLLASISVRGLEATLHCSAGMFAIALWDRKERRLSLARDRIGEKPLYWGWAGQSLVFGSELKALAAHSDFAGGVCRGALTHYLRFSYVPAPRSIHPGIYKLEPGTILDIAGQLPRVAPAEPLRPGHKYGGISIKRYWSLNATIEKGARNLITDDVEAVEGLEQVLGSAVRRQMISDVPLGAFLSGGVDSSTVVSLMQQLSTRPVKTFTIGFDEAAYDESPHAAAVARHLGTDHTAFHMSAAETRAIIPDLPRLYDEPFADSSQIPTHLVCRVARSQVKVALSGDAGDELFGGYNRYVLAPRAWSRVSWLPFPLRRWLATTILAVPAGNWDRLGAAYNKIHYTPVAVASLGDKAHRVAHRLREVADVDDLHRNITSFWNDPSALLLNCPSDPEPPSSLEDAAPSLGAEDPAARMMVQDLRTYLPDDILVKVDRASMGASLETRVPFLDPDVIEFAARLPISMKIRNGAGKWALRQVLYSHVPRSIIDRPKAGFGIPVGDWLRGPLRSWAEQLLSPEALQKEGLIDPTLVTRAWNEHLSRRRDWTHQLWIILMFQAWRECEQ